MTTTDTTSNLLVASSNKLGFKIWKGLQSTVGNLAISPASISSALTMTWAGARGDTALEMAKVLELDVSPEIAMADYARMMTGLLYDANFCNIELTIANRLFGEQTLSFNDKFSNDMMEAYGAGLEKLDFQNNPEGARQVINAWIASKTKDRIKEILSSSSVSSNTRLVIANALYFLANWKSQFDKEDTSLGIFKSNGERHDCNMMYRKGEYPFLELDDVMVIELPYSGNNMGMIIALPRQVDGLAKLEKELSSDLLMAWRRQLRRQEVGVHLPRFTIDRPNASPLGLTLKNLGMEKAFVQGVADFSGILDERIAIWDVYHKTFVKVNEQGTEMAAATAVAMTRGFSMHPIFRADHPFVWFIVDDTSDLVLGMGRVTEPKE